MKKTFKSALSVLVSVLLLFIAFSCKDKDKSDGSEIGLNENTIENEIKDEVAPDGQEDGTVSNFVVEVVNENDEDFFNTPFPESKIRYIPFRHKGEYGLIDEQKNVIMTPEFGKIKVYDYSILGLTRDTEDYNGILFDGNLNVLATSDMLEQVTEKYWLDESYPHRPSLINVVAGKKMFVDEKLNFTACNVDEEKYYAIQNQYLTKDLKKSPFDVKMSLVQPFHENRAVVYGYDGVYEPWFTVIDENGEKVFDGLWDTGWYYSDGLLPVLFDGGKSGFVNTSGELIIECNFKHDLSGGKIHPRIDYMFKDGVCIAKVPVKDCPDINEDEVAQSDEEVKMNEDVEIDAVEHAGEEANANEATNENISENEEGREDKDDDDGDYVWVIIDKEKNLTRLPIDFAPLSDYNPVFHEGYFVLKQTDGEKYIFINKKAKQVFGKTFDYADNFVNGYAVAVLDGRDVLISADGNIIDVEKNILK